MLDIWRNASPEFAQAVIRLQAESTNELVEQKKTIIRTATIKPYVDHELVRIDLKPQLIKRDTRNITIPSPAYSYVLVRAGDSSNEEILPFRRDVSSLIAVNSICKLSLTEENVIDYVIMVGLILELPQRYFIKNINHLAPVLSCSADDVEIDIRSWVSSLFKIADDGTIDCRIEQKTYPVLGRSFQMRMPCIYEDGMWATKIKIAGDGTPVIDNDQQFNIEGIVDTDGGNIYYPFDFSDAAEKSYKRAAREHTRWPDRALRLLELEGTISWVVFPPILFTLYVILIFGPNEPRLSAYFTLLQDSRIVGWTGFAVGSFLTIAFLFRVVLLNVAEATGNLVPNRYGDIVHAIKGAAKEEVRRKGLIRMMAETSFTYIASLLLALVVITYGLSNALHLEGMSGANLWQSMLAVLWAIPVIGDMALRGLANGADQSWLATHFTSSWYFGAIRFLLLSVLVGFLAKVFAFAIEKE